MTSLSAAFDEAPMNGTASVARDAAYSNPSVPRYEDNTIDEADKRYAYERGRQKLYAKSPPHHNGQRPMMSSQESFKEMRPGEYGKSDGPAVQKASVSCSSCHQDMCCSGDNIFCSSCNRQSLESSSASIPSLFK
jgi:hypothetical protein